MKVHSSLFQQLWLVKSASYSKLYLVQPHPHPSLGLIYGDQEQRRAKVDDPAVAGPWATPRRTTRRGSGGVGSEW